MIPRDIGLLDVAMVASGTGGRWFDVSGWQRLTLLVSVVNGMAPVPALVTLEQARDTSGISAEPLEFTEVCANYDTAADDRLARLPVAGNSFTTWPNPDKPMMYVMEVDSLDLKAGYSAVRVNLDGGLGLTAGVLGLLWPRHHYG